MLSIVGPVAFDAGLSERSQIETDPETGERTVTVRIFNTNTRKVVHSRFRVSGEPPSYSPLGTYEMDGVPGKQSQINLGFIHPGGAATGKVLPTGNQVDTLRLPDGGTIEASLVDVSNPGVFVRVSDLGVQNSASLDPAAVEADAALKARLEQIRQAGASLMGLDPNTQSVPKIVLVFPPEVTQQSPQVHIKCLALSMGQAHKSVPLTLGLCLGAAARLPGTIPNQLAVRADGSDTIVVGHPSGKLNVAAKVKDGEVLSVDLSRTARVLMKGSVFY
jgi:2-methylaconitate cis-trans-isomerase PrpF